MSKITALVLLAASCATAALAASCLEKFPDNTKYNDAQAACIKTLNLNATDIVAPADLKAKHYHDKCLSNCTLESLNFYSNGTILKEKILEDFKKSAPSTEVYEKIAKVVETCVEEANKKEEHKKHNKDKKEKKERKEGKTKEWKMHRHGHKKCGCKRAAKFMSCVLEKDKDLC